MKLSAYQQIFAVNIAKLILYAENHGIMLTLGEAYRTTDQQALYFNGKRIEVIDGEVKLVEGSKKSNTMRSNHLRRLAVDFNFFINGELTYDAKKIEPLGVYWESLHPMNRWGGHFKVFPDTPHFEMNV